MRNLHLFAIAFLISLSASAQIERDPLPVGEESVIRINSSKLFGRLVDSLSGKGIEAASVQLIMKDRMGKDSLVTGMLSRPNGDFSFENIRSDCTLILMISAIGFGPKEVIVRLPDNATMSQDLGNILLSADIRQLTGVTVQSRTRSLEMGIDRKVFNASSSLVSSGGTAIDLMKNIPSVSVDIDGNVQLRNSSPQIFVDGRPTILTLDQIPADNIDKVELITNPSAKFDAASSGGIINIVLKKNKRVGLNGVATAGVGTPGILTGNLNLNLRQGKFNFFLGGGYNQSAGEAKGRTLRENKTNGVTDDFFNQYTLTDRRRRFGFLRGGLDFFIDNRNTISVTQQFSKGRFGSEEEQDQQYFNSGRILQYYGQRSADGRSTFNRTGTTLNYKHSFPKAGKELTADVNYNRGSNDESSAIINRFFNPDGTTYSPTSLVNNDGSGESRQLTLQADYLNPVTDNTKFEIGARYYRNTFSSIYNAFADNNGSPLKLPLSNNYEYEENVSALYGTFSNKKNRFSYQLGLRAEYSQFNGTLIDSAFSFGYEYPSGFDKLWDGLFPSLFLTNELSDDAQIQFNYSRRIRRPQFWQLNPFVDINDPANLRQGNPALRPEFINSFEFNYSQDYKSGNILAVLYFRNNPNDITQYSDTISAAQYEQLQNAAVDPNAILNTFINASTTNRYGAEFTVQHRWKGLEITPTLNLQYRTVRANFNDLDLSNEGFNYEIKLITNYKIATEKSAFFNKMSFQLLGEYESAEVIPQGRRSPQYSADFAIRKDFLKNDKAAITFGINDIFNTNRWGTIYDTDDFYQDSYRRRNVRNFRLTFSYKFGDANFSLTRKRGDDGGED